jgi:hypothetical protein
VQDRLQEDTLDGLIILQWFDDAQNFLGNRVGARFPSFLNPDGTQSTLVEPVWDSRFHDLLIIYACARYRESDEAIGEAQYLDGLFQSRLSETSEAIQIPMMYKDDEYSQQFTAVLGQTDFIITKPSFPPNSPNLAVYKDGFLLTNLMDYRLDQNKITILTVSAGGENISAMWDTVNEFIQPPSYQGMW